MNCGKRLNFVFILILEMVVALGWVSQASSSTSTSGLYSMVLSVTTDQDDAAVATMLNGQKFMNHVGYSFIMITRGDVQVVIRGGYRFVGAPISQNSPIQSAKLKLNLQMCRKTPTSPDVPMPAGHTVSVFGQAIGNAPTFIYDANEFLARPRTTNQVAWTLPEGTVVGQWMEIDVTAVLQEIVNRADWAAGNAVAIFTEYIAINPAYYITRSYGATSPYPAQLEITFPASTGTLSIDSSPAKGVIFVNGANWGIAPQAREVGAGTYTVSFGAIPGYSTPAPQTVSVEAGTTTNIIGEYVFIGYVMTRYSASAMDDVSYAFNPSTGWSFYQTTGWKFNMITRGDVPVTIKGGYRFVNIAVPRGANIQNARMRLCLQMSKYASKDPDVPLPAGHVVEVCAEAVGDALPFTTDKNDFTARIETTARVTWTLPAGTVVGQWMEVDLTLVLQELVNRTDWSSGNAIVIFTKYNTPNPQYYIVHSYEGGTTPYPPQVTVTYNI